MTLDVSTLTFAGGLVAFASGLFVLMHWWQAREDVAALAWGTASCGIGIGIALLAVQAESPDSAVQIAAPIILNAGSVGTWAAARIFNRGAISPLVWITTAVAAVGFIMAAGASGHVQLAVVLNLGVTGAFYAAAAVEFWSGRAERLRGRSPMILLLGMNAIALFLAGVSVSMEAEFSTLPTLGWFGAIHFVALIYAGGSAICLITMLKDRAEIRHKAAALTDPLTGLANRRAFMAFAEAAFDASATDGTSVSLLAFDLDRFKSINDTFGHGAGDQVLRIFADVLSRMARNNDMAGRVGGEEFALALVGCDVDAALAVAGRVRVAFQDDARFVNGQPVAATVSVGVATAPEHGTELADVLASADSALYRAKTHGRNRVVLSVKTRRDMPPPVVTRIA
jgi:diguanylate cyclase (GGDEF)-like protein